MVNVYIANETYYKLLLVYLIIYGSFSDAVRHSYHTVSNATITSEEEKKKGPWCPTLSSYSGIRLNEARKMKKNHRLFNFVLH
jgi:hypothetical protein